MEKERIKKIVDSLSSQKVCVIGDSIIDVSYYCEALGLSLETPTLKAELKHKKIIPGGGFGVANNLKNIIISAYFITVVGDDEYSYDIKSASKNLSIEVIFDLDRRNNTKQRFWVQKGGTSYKYFQLNTITTHDIPDHVIEELKATIALAIPLVDSVIISDYRCGTLPPDVVNFIISECKTHNVRTLVNSQVSSHSLDRFRDFEGCDLLVVNDNEHQELLNFFDIQNSSSLMKILSCSLCITHGSKGSSLFIKDSLYNHVGYPTVAVDTCGAGDSFIAMLSACDYEQFPKESLALSNAWASLFVSSEQSVLPTLDDLKSKLCL